MTRPRSVRRARRRARLLLASLGLAALLAAFLLSPLVSLR